MNATQLTLKCDCLSVCLSAYNCNIYMYSMSDCPSYLVNIIHQSLVCSNLSVKCLMLLDLSLEIGRLPERFICSRLHFLIDPGPHLHMYEMEGVKHQD